MTFRITNSQTVDHFISQMFDQRRRLEDAREQVSTGIEITRPGDDPGRATAILGFQQTIQRIDRHTQRIAYATGMLSHQENTLSSAEDLMMRAQELATQGANGSQSSETRKQMAAEVYQLRNQLVNLANTTYQGFYLYGGADNDDPPFDDSTYTESPADPADFAARRVVFDGEDGSDTVRSVQITDTEQVRLVTSGSEVFSKAIGALERLGRSLDGYRTELDGTTGLPNGLGTAYSLPTDESAQIGDIRSALDAVSSALKDDIISERNSVGSRLSQLEQATSSLNLLKTNTEEARAAVQDADPMASASSYSNIQTSLQALLAAGAQINQLTLLDYI